MAQRLTGLLMVLAADPRGGCHQSTCSISSSAAGSIRG
ncbi:non-ribosomal peptide synthetase domain protein [Mycobacterium ulcerans str. Harvey]|uniref:Non-ribosomal peptide synthetase domain protein n=1 Tax=Mycobacterium ulcerans str. Harvey TaxID=1299332 RepID=A0ABN0R0H3_MYCUL|nr:non-ribosomal peptide synthetase domain protein [Mycobacterium ulcerans str. Harvey]